MSKDRSRAATYDLLLDYNASAGALQEVIDPTTIGTTPGWVIAVIRLGRPQSFSRRTMRSTGKATEGAFTRKTAPLIITDDCRDLTISCSKRSHVKTLAATLRPGKNYLSRDAMQPGDWMMAWCLNNEEDLERVVKQIRNGEPANGQRDGLKFVGRVHNIRKHLSQNPSGDRETTYTLQGLGFAELDTAFFYDMALATTAATHNLMSLFMAQIGLNWSEFSESEQLQAGRLKDNSGKILEALVNIIVGKGPGADVNAGIDRLAAGSGLNVAPQANKEAPYAYLVPRSVGALLGLDTVNGTKAGLFGYADVLETLIGVQEYENKDDNTFGSFVPELDASSTGARKRCREILKGTFLPVNPSFVNRPLWQVLQQYCNPAINEMYTALRVNDLGAVVPTLVVRQIPFTTESAAERQDFKLTRFLSLPRWKLHPTLVSVLDIGRSDATRVNMVHVYGEASTYASNRSITNQMVRNPPIFDELDIQRSGMRPLMKTVQCAVEDQLEAPRSWMEAIADWSFGSQYTLNGSVDCWGIQSPIAEGDNIELEGVAYHVEGITHRCAMQGDSRVFRTVLELSNGMPVDQEEATADFPRYPGFRNVELTTTPQGPSFESRALVSEATEGGGTDVDPAPAVATTETFDYNDPEFGASLDAGFSKAVRNDWEEDK